jgi:hypothetical protein
MTTLATGLDLLNFISSRARGGFLDDTGTSWDWRVVPWCESMAACTCRGAMQTSNLALKPKCGMSALSLTWRLFFFLEKRRLCSLDLIQVKSLSRELEELARTMRLRETAWGIPRLDTVAANNVMFTLSMMDNSGAKVTSIPNASEPRRHQYETEDCSSQMLCVTIYI